MGVKTLWGTLEPAAQWSTLLELSLEAFDKVGIRSIRLGCDASLWLFVSIAANSGSPRLTLQVQQHARKMAQDPAEEVGRYVEVERLVFIELRS